MPDINDLPKYSPWPSRLLGLTPYKRDSRTAEDLTREFDYEKWGSLLKKTLDSGSDTDLSTVEEWQYSSDQDLLGWMKGEWKILTAAESRSKYLDWITQHLDAWLGCESFVELGAGYGSVILKLAKRGVFGEASLYAGEYTNSGLRLLTLLAEREGITINTGHCDFSNPFELDLEVPAGSLIYTSYSATYISLMEYNFVESISKLDPSVVVHFEPVYEHFLGDELLSLMRRRYIEVNDYNRNILSLLRASEDRGEIEIILEREPEFGSNPLLPASVIAWRPNN